MRAARTALLFLIATLLSLPCVAGRLDDFESGLNRPTTPQTPPGGTLPAPSKDFFDGMLEEVIGTFLFEPISDFFHVVFAPAAQTAMLLQEQHEPGDAEIPVLRAELFTQHLSSGLYAVDVRSQLGYGAYVIAAQVSDYRERHPRDALLAARFGLGGRYAFGDQLQAQVVLGMMQFSGNNVTTRAWVALPLTYTLGNYALEYRPGFTDGVSEHDIAARYQRRYWSAELGYRTLSNARATLAGPYFGVGIHW